MNNPADTPPPRTRWFRTAALVVVGVLLAAGAGLWFLVATEAGLRTLTGFAAARLGDRLTFTAIEGRLIGPLRVDGLQLRDDGGHVHIRHLGLDWSPRRLFSGELRIEHLDLIDTDILLTASTDTADNEPPAARLRLPFDVSVSRALVHNLQFEDTSRKLTAQRILLSAYTQAGRLLVDALQLDADGLHAAAAGSIGLESASESQLSFNWQLEPREKGALASTGSAQVDGTLDDYRFNIDASVQSAQLPSARWRASGDGNLQGLNIGDLHGELLDGSVSGGGQVHWQPQLRWDMTLAASRLNPGQHWGEWPGELSGQLSSEGSYSDNNAQLSAQLEQLSGQLRGYAVTGQVDAALQGEQVQLSLQWQLDPQHEEAIASNGKLQLDGTLDAYRFNARTAVHGGQLPASEWHAVGDGNLQRITIDQLRGDVLEGSVSGRATLDWQPHLQWDVTLAAEQVNPGQHWSEWPGNLSAQLASKGSYLDDKPRLNAQLTKLAGQLRGYPVNGQADVAVDGEAISIRTLKLQSGNNHLTASGDLGERLKLDARLDARDLSAVAPDLRGSADISARVLGDRKHPEIKAQLTVSDLDAANIRVQSLRGDVDLHWIEKARQSIRLQASDINYSGHQVGETTLTLAGPLEAHNIRLVSRTGKQSAEVALNGGWDGQQWQGRLETAQWDIPQTGAWTLTNPVALRLAGNSVQVPETCWFQQQAKAKLCGAFQSDPAGQWQAETQLHELPLTLLDDLFGTRLQWSSPLNGNLQASGTGGRLDVARLNVVVGAGSLRYGDQAKPVEEQIKGIDLNAVLGSDGADATLNIALAGSDHLDTRVQLPGYQPQVTPWKQQPLSLSMRGRLRELASLGYVFEDVATFKGSVDVDISAGGTLGEPVIQGGASIEDGNISIARLGIELRELQLAIQSQRDAISMRGSCLSGKGLLSVDGSVEFEDIARWSADVKVQGSNFEVVHIPEAVVLVSPDLQARIRPPAIDLRGELHVPSARLKPKQMSGGVTVSRDVIIVDPQQPETPVERWKVTSQVRLSLGEQVTLDGFGVKGKLTGRLDLRDEPERVTRARGKVAIEKGTYTVYGRELNIAKGQLLFSDGPVDNPGLDFDAERVVGDVHAGVRARGTLKEPELSLYSDPALSDADIVSYITLGRPAAQAGESSGSPADALAIASGSYLAGTIGETLGLDEVKVESNGALDEASLVLGTYLSPQLYVRYSAGLNETANRFEAVYELSRNWSIRTQTSQNESGADIIFSFER